MQSLARSLLIELCEVWPISLRLPVGPLRFKLFLCRLYVSNTLVLQAHARLVHRSPAYLIGGIGPVCRRMRLVAQGSAGGVCCMVASGPGPSRLEPWGGV